MPIAYLPERGIIRVAGDEARSFLQGLLTCDLERISTDRAGYGALLSPQGKIVADFLIVEAPRADGGGFLLDCLVTRVTEVMKRLTLYKLRAKITISDLSDTLAVLALWGGAVVPEEDGLLYEDPRLSALGGRAIVARDRACSFPDTPATAWNDHRIALGIPDGGKDFGYDEAFPHEALLDQLGGVDFRKGCYVGQEVVSRMEHRGTARSRIVPIVFADGIVSEWGLEASAGGKPIGNVGSTGAGRGLALLRLDRVGEAMAGGQPLMAGGLVFTVAASSLTRFAVSGWSSRSEAFPAG